MIGTLPPWSRGRVETAIAWPRRVDELRSALGAAFMELCPSPAPDAITFVHRDTMAIVEAAREGPDICGSPVLVEGEDARTYFTDLLGRNRTFREVTDLLAHLQGSAPYVLELFRRGQRFVLPRLPCVVELRGQGVDVLESVRILPLQESLAAIDGALRVQHDEDGIRMLLGELRPLDPHPPARSWLVLDGRIGVGRLAGGGFRLLHGEALAGIVARHAKRAATPDRIERLVAGWLDVYGRREEALPRGGASVTWRLYPLEMDLCWVDGDVLARPVGG